MLSSPIARSRIPQIQRAPHRFSMHQPVMKRKRGSGGSQNSDSTAIA
jgi:hypothetical protein